MLKENNSTELFKSLKKLTQDKVVRRKLQNKFYKNNNFNIKIISKSIDKIRSNILLNTNNHLNEKNIKILHIANFNELSDGRLFYSFSNKLNNGFIKNNCIVQTISDRTFLKYNKRN